MMPQTPSTPDPTRPLRIAGLDLLRGLAIALVIVRHAWPAVVGSGGIVGVVVFFSLSGYLITGLLVSDISRFGKVRYRRFYRNRALRLIPALALFVLGLLIITSLFDPLGERAGLLRAVVVSMTYTADVPFEHGSSAIAHLWSVSTEEQFYLVWPIVLVIGLRVKRLGLAFLLSSTMIVIGLIGTIIVASPETHRVYGLPSSWAIAMMIGATACIWESSIIGTLSRLRLPKSVLAGIALMLLVALAIVPDDKSSPLTYLLLVPIVAGLTTLLIFHVREWTELPAAWLTPLLWLGKISYAAYLWNYAIVVWLGGMGTSPLKGALSIALTVAAATASWFAVEKPTAHWKARLDLASSRSLSSQPRNEPELGLPTPQRDALQAVTNRAYRRADASRLAMPALSDEGDALNEESGDDVLD